jgi:hypothetical protein
MLQPPNINGVMTLTDAEKTDVTTKLQTIQAAFVPTDFQVVADTFYITSTYNKQYPGLLINGDTCEALLAGVVGP